MRFLILLLAAPVLAAAPATEIKVDQVGYLTNSPKVALVACQSPATGFTVCGARE